jgi:hypothetical protein
MKLSKERLVMMKLPQARRLVVTASWMLQKLTEIKARFCSSKGDKTSDIAHRR